eukprot:8008881-Pyramimonas_sp.AAC.1
MFHSIQSGTASINAKEKKCEKKCVATAAADGACPRWVGKEDMHRSASHCGEFPPAARAPLLRSSLPVVAAGGALQRA